MQPRGAAAVSLLVLSWSIFFVCITLIFLEWKDKVSDVFPASGLKVSPFVKERSRLLFLIYLFLLIYSASVSRTLGIIEYVLRGNVTTDFIEITVSSYLLLAFAFIYVLQAWRMRLKYQYYVVIANSDWTKLVDSSLESDISFWIKYKALLTSEKAAAVTFFVSMLLWGAVLESSRANIGRVRNVIIGGVLLTDMAIIPMLWHVPETVTFLKTELKMIIITSLTLSTISIIMFASVTRSLVTSILTQLILISLSTIQFYVSFIWSVQQWRKYENQRTQGEKEASEGCQQEYTIRNRVFEVLSDASVLSSFMQYSCENWCAENVLCLIELKEFKHDLRKTIQNELRSTTRGSVISLGFGEVGKLKDRKSADKEDDGDEDNEDSSSSNSTSHSNSTTRDTAKSGGNNKDCSTEKFVWNNMLINQAKQKEYFPQSDFFDESLCSWDLHCKVSLSSLGCKSSIVSNKDTTLAKKARLLCEKYFEYTSQYCVNVSESSRRVVLNLVGEHSTISNSLDSLVLLFLFDEAVKDLIDNLNDSLLRFYQSNKE